MPRWAGHNTDLPSDSNISKTVRVNIAFAGTGFKKYSTSFLIVCRLIDIALAVLKLLMSKICVIIGISKSSFSIFPVLKGLNELTGTKSGILRIITKTTDESHTTTDH